MSDNRETPTLKEVRDILIAEGFVSENGWDVFLAVVVRSMELSGNPFGIVQNDQD